MNTQNTLDFAIIGSLSTLVVAGVLTAGMGSALILGTLAGGAYLAANNQDRAMNTQSTIDIAILGTLSTLVVAGILSAGFGSALVIGTLAGSAYLAIK